MRRRVGDLGRSEVHEHVCKEVAICTAQAGAGAGSRLDSRKGERVFWGEGGRGQERCEIGAVSRSMAGRLHVLTGY